MSAPYFRKIAVLNSVSFPSPEDGEAEDASIERILRWTMRATDLGADAIYARVHTLPERWALQVIRMLGSLPASLVPQLIIPAEHAHLSPHYNALQFRKGQHLIPERKLPHLKYGFSCHSAEEVLEAQKAGFDYVFFSPVFSTMTHPETPPLGTDKLREVCAATRIPVFALGGISAENEKACIEAGAFGIAAISLFLR